MTEPSESGRNTAAGTGRGLQKKGKWGPILVGTDGSEGAARAVEAAGALAADLDVEVWVATVMDRSSEPVLERLARDDDASIGDVAETMARRVLNDATRRAEAAGARKIHTVVRSGPCAEELIAAAQEVDARVIAVGRRGAGGRLSEALIGSVSQKLAGLSPRMVVIVP